ncbi:MAG: [FeFe] hydrogenase H-cluster maturation GTPase HydF, partial [Candidatus Margulisiibacteriota bacterium]
MYKTPASGRLHIGIFGRRNTGKSSLINAISGQKLAIVSDIAGTTTDPVSKAMEILPLGPCLLIDTAGIDDVGALGEERVKKTLKVLQKTDLAILVVDPDQRLGEYETGLLGSFREKKIPFIVVINKSDLPLEPKVFNDLNGLPFLKVSAVTRAGIEELKEKIMAVAPANWSPVPLVSDIVKPKQVVVLVCPIDVSMPQGRLILPEVQVLRDVMDADAAGYMTKDTELEAVLGSLKKQPDLVVTDSQAFSFVSKIVPAEVPLTSFSIVFARHRGDLNAYLSGAAALKTLKDGDRVLV